MIRRVITRLGLNTDPEQDALVIVLLMIAFLLMVGTVVFQIAEDLTPFDALYFAMMSISTIGYGDIVPTTMAGKLMVMLYSIVGVPLFIYTAGLFVELRIRRSVATMLDQQKEQLQEIGDELEDISEDIEKVENKLKNKKKKNHIGFWQRLIAKK